MAEIPHGQARRKGHGGVYFFQCDDGGVMVGSSMVVCDGIKWNGTAPTCHSKYYYYSHLYCPHTNRRSHNQPYPLPIRCWCTINSSCCWFPRHCDLPCRRRPPTPCHLPVQEQCPTRYQSHPAHHAHIPSHARGQPGDHLLLCTQPGHDQSYHHHSGHHCIL